MMVRLQVDDQFGPEGPQSGAEGSCLEVREIDAEYWAYVIFKGSPPQLCMVKLEDVMSVNTENTESYRTTHP